MQEFKLKTPAEFEALTEYQQEKYLDEKAKFEKEQQEKLIKETAEKLVAEKLKEAAEEAEKKGQEAIDAIKAEAQKQVEDVLAALNRAKQEEVNVRIKTMSDEIIDKFSSEEGEKMLKDFLAGQKHLLKMDVETKAMINPIGSVAPDILPIVGPGSDDFHARNLIPSYPTMSDLISYLEVTIDPSAQGIDTVKAGAKKPNMGYLTAVKKAPVVKIAGLLDVVDEFLDDVVGFRAWLAYELPKALLDAEDLQIYKGDGDAANDNLLGVWYQADNQTFPMGSVTASSNRIDQVAAGITEIRTRKRGVNGAVISPVDWMEMYINKDLELAYTYPVIFTPNGLPTILGVPVYWSNVFEDGEGVVGDFRYGVSIRQRMQARIAYSGENKDNFETNTVTIRIEERLALPITFPDGFLKLFQATT